MATVTLVANTDYSALTLANDDTIDCAGFVLTLDIQPTHTGIQVTSPGTAGTVVFSGGWVIPTWDFFVGTASVGGMIATLPTGAVIKSITAGSTNNSRGVLTNYGTIGTSNGGSGGSSFGVNTNFGVVTTSNGGSAGNAHGVQINNVHVGTANGGSGVNARGVSTNNGTVISANGGSVGNGILNNLGQCLRISDGVALAVANWNGTLCFVEGPFILGTIPDNIKTIYSLGTLSGSAMIAGDASVITLSEGSGVSRPVNPFTQQVIG